MRRTGIDVSSTGCLMVDAERIGRRAKGEPAIARVHGFTSVSSSEGTPLAAQLKLIVRNGTFPRRAWVNLWNVRSIHQYRLLPVAREAELAALAKHHGASALEMDDTEVTAAAAFGRTRTAPRQPSRREVSFFAASTQEIRDHLRPIVDAGFIVEGVTTPCGALWSQARLRRQAAPGEVNAFVALGVCQSALGIFADGLLLYARDLDWGYASPAGSQPVLDRYELAKRLSLDLQRAFLYVNQFWEPDVSQIVLCGDMPNLRSLTAPLIERLNIEVETLDTLEGIDAACLPAGFAEYAAAFRLASAVAVEPPPANLLPLARPANRMSDARRVATVGSAAAVLLSALLYGEADVRERKADRQATQVAKQLSSRRPASAERGVPAPAIEGVLRRVSDTAPRGISLTSLRVEPHADHWNLFVEAYAEGPDAAEARRNSEQFLERLTRGAQLGEPIHTRIQTTADAGAVEVAAAYRVLK